ncbi:hypothetical protein NHQ30_007738 [Ciborinia camelliae]|nr:hypothetical protein NHQ30_007738 [Ciborinia camelliae]
MRASTILTIVLSTLAIAGPIKRSAGTDDVIVYPDENLYSEEYKRTPGKIPEAKLLMPVHILLLTLRYIAAANTEADDSIIYPDEKFYTEEYKRHTSEADDSIVYRDEKLYSEEYKRHTVAEADDSIVYPDEKPYSEEY